MKWLKTLILPLSLLSLNAWSTAKLQGVELKTEGEKAVLKLTLSEVPALKPELSLGKDHIQVVLSDTQIWPKIEKKATLTTNNDTTLMAYQFDKNIVRARAVIPHSFLGAEKLVTMKQDGKVIEVHFPKVVAENTKNAGDYDETYLDTLTQEKSKHEANPKVELKKDAVTTTQASSKIVTNNTPSFSIASYVGKFVAFLGVVLLLFYGVVQLMKKGVLGKGKLGFLNATNLVEVISTTYVAPKRNLMLVKAHKQIFLIAQSESGIQFLSELSDTTGLIKEGEKEYTGTNFDTTLTKMESNDNLDKKVKLKKMIEATESKIDTSDMLVADIKDQEDQVSFSAQMKKKLKGLKPLSQ